MKMNLTWEYVPRKRKGTYSSFIARFESTRIEALSGKVNPILIRLFDYLDVWWRDQFPDKPGKNAPYLERASSSWKFNNRFKQFFIDDLGYTALVVKIPDEASDVYFKLAFSEILIKDFMPNWPDLT
jgi:hypothetical protein